MSNNYDVDYYAGTSLVDHIPSDFREYDRRTAFLTKIAEGRSALMRLLLQYAQRNGAYVARDTRHMWGLEHERLARMYFTANSTSTGSNTHDIFQLSNDEASRLQSGDVLNLMGMWVKMDSSTGRTMANATGEAASTKTAPYILPEQIKVLEVYGDDSATTGHANVKVRRNFGGTAPTGHADLTVDYDNTTYKPFLWKAGNSVAEGRDDQMVYSDVDSTDYNYAQIVMRKWAATETEQNVDRFFTNENTFQRNGRRALGEFFKELDMIATFGTRKTELENGRRKWYTGGIMEFVPEDNYIEYTDSLFNTANFNEQIKNMFYYGNQTKVVLTGADFYTKFSNMIDNKIVLPAATNGWGIELTRYNATNGGTLLFAPSDSLSLHGMSDYAIVLDPAHFQYGHLQNMDIKSMIVSSDNPHEKEGEIYGQITFKRTNPDAHWMFVAS